MTAPSGVPPSPAADRGATGDQPPSPRAPAPLPAAAAAPGGHRGRAARVLVLCVVLAAVVAALVRQGPEPGPGSRAWEHRDLGGSQYVVSDGERVCSVTLGQLFYCLDPATGGGGFRRQLDEREQSSPPVLVDDRVLVGSSLLESGTIRAFSFDGEQLWSEAVDLFHSPFAAVDGVVAALDGEDLVGLDVATGDERWRRYDTPETTDATAAGGVFGDGERFYGAVRYVDETAGGIVMHVVALDPRSGRELWRSPQLAGINTSVGIGSMAALDDGRSVAFHLEGAPGRMLVVAADTGRVRWDVTMASPYGTVTHAAGTTVVADGADLRAFDGDGRELWRVSAHNPNPSNPGALVAAGGRLFAAGPDVHEIDHADGGSVLVRTGVDAMDVGVVGDQLIIAGAERLEAVPLRDLDT